MECMASTSSMLPSPIETSSPKAGGHRRFPGGDPQHATHICEVFEDEMHGKALILPLMTFRDVQNALGTFLGDEFSFVTIQSRTICLNGLWMHRRCSQKSAAVNCSRIYS